MTEQQTSSQYNQSGQFKMPAIVIGAGLSVAAHAAVLVVVGAVVSGNAISNETRPTQLISRGEPIRVYLPRPIAPDDLQEPNDALLAEVDEPELTLADMLTEPGLSSDAMPPLSLEPASQLVVVPMTQLYHILPPTPPTPLSPLIPHNTHVASDALTLVEPDAVIPVLPAPQSMPGLPTPTVSADAAPPSPQPSPPTPPLDEPSLESHKLGLQQSAEPTDVPSPIYPQRSIRLGQFGDVEVAVEVLASGRVGRVTIHKPSRHRLLNEAALAAAKKAHFTPATKDGQPVASTIILPIEFHLR